METKIAPMFRIAFLAAVALFLLAGFAPLAQAQEGEEVVRSFTFNFYFSYGRSYGECYGNCMASCQSACYSSAGGSRVISCSCGGPCGSGCGGAFAGCAGQIICQKPVAPQYSPAETGTTETEDGLPVFPSAEGGVPIGGQGVTPGETEEQQQVRAQQETRQYLADWEQYCASAGNCQSCANRDRCIWTGAGCTSCRSTTCRFVCPNGQRVETQQPPTPSQAREQAVQAPQTTPLPSNLILPGTTPVPTFEPTPAPPEPTPVPKPALNCRTFETCQACTSATPAQEGNCAWSEFTNLCISISEMAQLDQFDIKTGWTADREACARVQKEQDEEDCSDYGDCFTCTGVGGVKRKCQWSFENQACVKYAEGSDFKTAQKDGEYAVFPGMCQNHNCSKYSECEACAQNSRCAWSAEQNSCNQYNGVSSGIINSRWCPKKENLAKLPKMCPYGCECDEQYNLIECENKGVDPEKIISPRRAALTAWSQSGMEKVETILLVGEEGDAAYSYYISGKRTGAFLGLWPVDMNYIATVNATTGKVESIEKPWWNVLTT